MHDNAYNGIPWNHNIFIFQKGIHLPHTPVDKKKLHNSHSVHPDTHQKLELLHNNILIPDLPRKASVAVFRLYTTQMPSCPPPQTVDSPTHSLHLVQRLNSDIKSQLSIIGMQEGEWRTSKNLSITNQLTIRWVLTYT